MTHQYQRYILLVVFILLSLMVRSLTKEAQQKFVDGKKFTILSRPSLVSKAYFRRIDSLSFSGLTERVKYLSTNSSGIQIMFQTNSRQIDVRWKVREYITKPNLTPIAISGLDLYGWNGKEWQYVASAMPESENTTATFIKNLDGQMRHYKIYLPLYSELTDIRIGIDEGADIEPADPVHLPVKKVAIYGSSITQGASASRPGMAYPSILGRMLNLEIFNLGFSGAGKMEIEMAEILSKIDVDLYILDCVPNPTPEQIKDRAGPFIRKLHDLKPDVPILMVESIFREVGYWDNKRGAYVREQNKAFKKVYEQLQSENFQRLYYIPCEELIGSDHEATIDGTHLTDLGQLRIAQRIGIEICKIFNFYSVD